MAGWVETVRDQKKVQFVILRDESGAVQLVNPATRELDGGRRRPRCAGSGARAHRDDLGPRARLDGARHGRAQARRARQARRASRSRSASLEVVSEALPETPIADDSSLDKRLDWRFLDLRRPEANLIFRVQTTFEHALRTWWVENDFVEIHTPKLMASASESRAELFELELLRGQGVPVAEPAVLQADGAARRLRQAFSRSRPRSAPTPRSPRATRPSSRRSTPR